MSSHSYNTKSQIILHNQFGVKPGGSDRPQMMVTVGTIIVHVVVPEWFIHIPANSGVIVPL